MVTTNLSNYEVLIYNSLMTRCEFLKEGLAIVAYLGVLERTIASNRALEPVLDKRKGQEYKGYEQPLMDQLKLYGIGFFSLRLGLGRCWRVVKFL